MKKTNQKLAPIHPGEIISEELLKPYGLNASEIAKSLNVPVESFSQILAGRKPITADMALRLSRFFDTTPQFWMNLQSHYDLQIAEATGGNDISKNVKPFRKGKILLTD